MDRRGLFWALGACAMATLAYVPLASPHVLGGDNGEFATLFAEGGVAHPPGYPLYTLLLRACAWLPARSPAHGAALATAMMQVGAVAMLVRACRSWGASVEAAALAAVAYALSASAWALGTHAEVFALNALLAAAIVDAAGRRAHLTGARRAVLLGWLAGLGLSHHPTILALGPVGCLGMARGLREASARGPGAAMRAGGSATLAFLVGLAPYAYTLWTSHHRGDRWAWGDAMGLADLWRHVRRSDYWDIAAADPRGPVSYAAHLSALGEHVARDLLWVLPAIAVLGVGVCLVRAKGAARVPSRLDVVALLASLALAGPAFLFMMSHGIGNVPFSVLGVAGRIVERFYLLPEVLLCVPVAWGLDLVIQRVHRARTVACLVAATVIVLFDVALSRPRVVEEGRGIVEAYLLDTLQTLPPRAVLVGTGDHRAFGFLYGQRALGVRPDVLFIDANLVRTAFYRRRVESDLGFGVPTDAAALVARLASSERPLFLTNDVDQTTRTTLPTYAVGTVIRVLAPGATSPGVDELEAMNLALAPRLHRDPIAPVDRWEWAADADEAYARPWLELALRFRAADLPVREEKALELANRR